jgi:general secretion pathway protein G
MSRKRLLRQAAFTLIELMVVIVIIAILAGVVVPRYVGRTEQAYDARVMADMKAIGDAIRFFKMDVGRYPDSLKELYEPPPEAEKWHGPYLETADKDPWGKEYIYELGSDSSVPFTLKCYGADGNAGGEGENKDYSNLDSFNEQGK